MNNTTNHTEPKNIYVAERPAIRKFTSDEQRTVIYALLTIRPRVDADERKIIDGILRDGWKDS